MKFKFEKKLENKNYFNYKIKLLHLKERDRNI